MTDYFTLHDAVATSNAAFTADNTTDTLTSTAHGLSNGDCITVENSGGALPTGLSANTRYFVINSAANTFKLSATKGGSAIDITADGSGTQTFYRVRTATFDVSDWEYAVVSVSTSGSAALTFEFEGAIESGMDFLKAQAPANMWDFLDIEDLQNKASIDGDTKVALTGTDDNRLFRIDVRGLKEVAVNLFDFTVGTATVKVSRFKNL